MLRTDGSDGGPAFPIETTATPYAPGMSLRDWFAGQALIGLYAGRNGAPLSLSPEDLAADAEIPYLIADAMIAARDK